MQNLDRIKNIIGEDQFSFIGSLNKEQLIKMQASNEQEITNVVTRVYSNPSNEYYNKLINEKYLIKHRLN